MDYGLKYYFEFTAKTSGIPFSVEILKQNFPGLIKRVSIGASPVLSVDEESDGVRGSFLQLSLKCKIEGMISGKFEFKGDDLVAVIKRNNKRISYVR